MTTRIKQWALAPLLLAFATLGASGEEVILHNAETIDSIRMTWAGTNPNAALEINSDKHFVSEGTGSILARSVVPEEGSDTSYVGFRVPVEPMRLDGRALAFEVWSSEAANTRAFHVRGLNAKGKVVVGWASWAKPLDFTGQTMLLVPGRQGVKMKWEVERIAAPDDEIVYLEFIAGSLSKGQPYNMYVDHIRLVPAEAASK